MILNVPGRRLERVVYFVSYIITKVDKEAQKKALERINKEYKQKTKIQKLKLKSKKKKIKTALKELKEAKDRARAELSSLKPLKIISETEYRNLSLKYGEVFEAGTGAEALRKIFEKIDLKKEISKLKRQLTKASGSKRRKTIKRLKLFQATDGAGIRPEWMFLTVIPVLPPDLRPIVRLDGGRYAASDLNDLYRRVINRNNRLKYLLEIAAPDVIVRNEKRMLQEAVDALIDNQMRTGTTTKATTGGRRLLKSLADMLKGKKGRFRQNLLGKRVDYSGRSVIVIGPELRLGQVGIPKTMALELFKPFVIKKLLDKELAYNVRGASGLIETETDEVWASLEEVVQERLVLLNRAPTLHRLGIQAFKPVLIEGEAIKVHPLVCKAFNADFDGDQMAVYLPLSREAQDEAKDIMLSSLNLLKPATGIPIIIPTQDIVLGCYWLTKIIEGEKGEGKVFGSSEEAILAFEKGLLDLRAKIKVKNKKQEFTETSLGRIIFNEALPSGFPFQNEHFNSKKLEKLMGEIIRKYDREETVKTLDKIKDLGFEYSTISGISWGMDDLIIPKEKPQILARAEKNIEQIESHFKKGLLSESERASRVIEVWQKAKTEIEKLVPKTLSGDNPVFQIIDSGSRGSWTQPVQMSGMKGLVINPAGKIIELPVKSSYKEGFDVLEYFISTHGARKGTADTALRTSTAGYLTRRLIDVAHEVIVTEEDCKDKKGITLFRKDASEIGQNFIFKIVGRYSLEKIKDKKGKTIVKEGEMIDWEKGEKIIQAEAKKVRVRSPLSCRSTKGVCQKCYGWDLGRNKPVELGETVGIVAAQAIGEPGTQLTMRTFHAGGVAGGGDITQGLPRVEEIFERRVPKGKAEVSPIDGKVLEITPTRLIKIEPKANPKSKSSKTKKADILKFKVPPETAIWIEKGQAIKKGQQLYEGSLDLKKLFKLVGKKKCQRYIIKEIQKIYVSQGAIIHDKHVEIIARQMLSRIKIKDPGDSKFTLGQIVERAIFLEENSHLKKKKNKPARGRPVLLGITKVALTTDSFLSAASFQQTSRILIKSVLEGKEDRLRGLKENVIIGKLIPAGTGFKKE
jgi:DNA-directed RNA polymerase subunit beta'